MRDRLGSPPAQGFRKFREVPGKRPEHGAGVRRQGAGNGHHGRGAGATNQGAGYGHCGHDAKG